MRPFRACGLCQQERFLADSHFLPKALYRLFQGSDQASRNPLHLTSEHKLQTSAQMKDYFLCDDCEDRFNKRGELWTMKHCYRGGVRFQLRDLLYSHQPFLSVDDSHVYDAASISGLDHAALTYFAASIFWRAAARAWRLGPSLYEPLRLGPYAERLRLYLLDLAAFPAPDVSLTVFVSMRDQPLLGMVFPVSESSNEYFYKVHRLLIPGIQFLLTCGKNLHEEHLRGSIAASPYHYIFASPHVEDIPAVNFLNLVRKHRGEPPPNL